MRPLPTDLVRRLRGGGAGVVVVAIRTGAMGDVLRTIPAVRLVRGGLPGSRIYWMVEDRWSPILEGHPDLDGVLALPRAQWRRAVRSVRRWPELAGSISRWRGRLRALHADVVLDFHGNLRSGILGLLTGAPVRLGYKGHQQKEGNRWFTTHRVASGSRRESRIDRNLSLVRALGIPDAPLPDGGLPESRPASLAAHEIAGDDPFAVLSPGASRKQSYKKPPTELLAAAARRLAHRGILPFVVYGPGEAEDAERVMREVQGAARLAPPTDLPVLAALLRRARVFVGGDTGPLHLACAVGCPVLGLYGPTDPSVNAPWGVPHLALHPVGRRYSGIKRRDRGAGGFEGLTAAAVEDAVETLLRMTERSGTQRA